MSADALHRYATKEAQRRATTRSMGTIAARKLADESWGKRYLSIDDYRRMALEECNGTRVWS